MNRNRATISILFLLLAPSFVPAQTVDFSIETLSGSYCTPARIRFNGMASGATTGFVWVLGNLGTSNQQRPAVTFTTPGTYQIKMIALYNKQAISVIKNITIHPGVSPGFTMSRNQLCAPGQVSFSANPGQGSLFLWNFGDGSGDISSNSPTISHQFSQFGDFQINLKAIASTGCAGEAEDELTIQPPEITGTVSPPSGCTPALAGFHSLINVPPGSQVNSYTWNFGDGQVISNAQNHITHQYNQPGNFQPVLTISTSDGCSRNFEFTPLAFGTPPVNLTAYPIDTSFCGSESAGFIAKATNANRYLWDFGNQDTVSVTDTIIHHKFKYLGINTVTVTPFYNECAGLPVSFEVNVIGAISKFDYRNTCSDKKTFHFVNNSQGHQLDIIWSVGGVALPNHENEIYHQFPASGSVPVSLFVTDDITGCTDLLAVTIYTADPELENPDQAICKGSTANFEIINNYENPHLNYEWEVIGTHAGPGLTDNPFEVMANQHGHFNNNLVIIDNGSHYCKDTVIMNDEIIVRGPVLDFDVPGNFCGNLEFTVTNHSMPYIAGDDISAWKWDYGVPVDAARDTAYNPRTFIYNPYHGIFNISLKATDVNGCTDSLNKSITVYKVPFVNKIPDMDNICSGQSSTLIAFHSDPITWSPSSGVVPCISCDTLTVYPTQTTRYVISSINQWNCEAKDSVQVVVNEPFTAIATPDHFNICPGESVSFNISPQNKMIAWMPANQFTLEGFTPTLSPNQSGIYTAILQDSAGCFNSRAEINVQVKPLPSIEAGPDRVVPYRSSVSLSPMYSSNVAGFLWSPPTNLDCTDCAAPVCLAINSNTYTITVTSDSGCVARDKISVIVECANSNIYVPTAFTPNRDGLNDLLRPTTRGIRKIARFAIYNRQGILMYEVGEKVPNERSWGWDGMYQGKKQPQATYVYLLQAVCDAGETISAKGSFLLIR